MSGESWSLSVTEAIAAFDQGLDRAAHLAACHARAVAVEPEIAAFTVMAEAEPSEDSLPLSGIALGIKDLYDTADLPTSYGAKPLRDHRPAKDAALVQQLKALGASVAAKTVTTEFAWREAGPTCNPWGLAHTPGGSSSGSAAAVAAGSVPLAIGTQTYGSVVRPAAFCGVVGFKPGRGILSLEGAHPLAPSLDHAGLFTRKLADIAYVFGLLTGAAAPQPAMPPRITFDLAGLEDRLHPEQLAVLHSAAAVMRTAGAEVVEQASGPDHNRLRQLADVLLAAEAAEIFPPILAHYPGEISRHIAELVERGCLQKPGEAAEARRELAQHIAHFAAQPAQIILTPAALGPAPLLAQGTGDPVACTGWTALGLPALALPWALSSEGLPLGIQLVAPAGAETELLAAAAWVETLRIGIGFPSLAG